MAYTIVKSDGNVLTTIADGTINTTSTSQGLPGRNYAGYGQTLDTNIVHQLENFADDNPPINPLRGQLWYNTNANTLYVCPADNTSNALAWLALTSTSSGGTTTFGAVTVNGTLSANNITVTNTVSALTGSFTNISVTANATIANANVQTGSVTSLTSSNIMAGTSSTSAGTLTGQWTLNGDTTALNLQTGDIVISNSGGANTYGIKTDKYMYANGNPISFAGTYSNANVAAYLPSYTGTLQPSSLTTTSLITSTGTIAGTWTLTSGSKLQATYADLAERFAADAEYDAGTVVQIGGENEITAVKLELSEEVLGVVSENAAYLMNAGAGTDKTHPAIAIGGRVPVKVIGKVKKGQRLVSAGDGVARAATVEEANPFNTIGRSLVDKNDEGSGSVEVIVTIK